MLDHAASLAVPEAEFVYLAVGSEGAASRQLATSCGWDYIEAPNEPVSDKWNAGAAHLQDWDVDAVVVLGSDNLISARYWKRLPVLLNAGRAFAYFDHVHYFDLATGRCVRAAVPFVGAGRLLSRQLLDALDWKPWLPGRNSYLDRSMGQRLFTLTDDERGAWHGFNEHMDPGAVVVDLKGDDGDNIWSFGQRLRMDRHRSIDGPAFLRESFPNVAGRVLKLSQTSGVERQENDEATEREK